MGPIPYDTHREFTIPEGCPWYEAQQSYGPPNVNWCEPTICSYVNEPANTWSNLTLVLVAVWVIKTFRETEIRWFGLIVGIAGIGSGVFHATNNYLTQYFDFLGMFLITSYLMAFNTLRLPSLSKNQMGTFFWMFYSMHVILFMLFDIVDWPIQPIVAIGSLSLALMDLYCGWKEALLSKYHLFFIAAVLLIIAQACAIIDIQRVYCNPDNLFFHGHVFWHLINSTSMFIYAFHMKLVMSKKIR